MATPNTLAPDYLNDPGMEALKAKVLAAVEENKGPELKRMKFHDVTPMPKGVRLWLDKGVLPKAERKRIANENSKRNKN